MIRMHFPDVADSPTLRTPIRIRYAMAKQPDGRTVPELLYAHGTHRLTRDAWQGFHAAGATLTASTDREARILLEVLGTAVPVLPDADGLVMDGRHMAAMGQTLHESADAMRRIAAGAGDVGVALQRFVQAVDKDRTP